MIIHGGTGNGHSAEVDSNNRLKIYGAITPLIHHVSEDENDGYLAHISTTANSLTITVTGGPILYMRNNDTTRLLVVSYAVLGVSAAMSLRVIRNPVLGTIGNENALIPGNLNFSSGRTASITCYNWDEVGDGMTGISDGTVLGVHYMGGAGSGQIDMQDAVILDTNDSISFELVGAGEASLNVPFMMYIGH